MQDSFLNNNGYRYLWVSLILMVASIVAYILHEPFEGPNGGSWLGYTLGTIGALIIFWLTAFGYRKRTYNNRVGTLRGWLSAHVYLGTSLILIATLHTGFQFGWNVHTLAYTLMMAVILSGFFGVFAYLRYPTLMTRNRASTSRQMMLDEISELDEECLRIADKLDPKVHQIVVRSVQNTRLGGGIFSQLMARNATAKALDQTRDILEESDKGTKNGPKRDMPTMFAMVDFLSSSGGDRSAQLRQLLDHLNRKNVLASKVARDIQFQAIMEFWLYIHVPLTFALLGSLTAHIVSVFFYW